MRINKQSRPWALAGRRLFRERLKPQDGQESGISQAGNTVLETVLESNTKAFGPVADSIANADPTQRLLTMLGRFNRYVCLAESGNAHENWCDDCMDQLISGIEIALSESWVDVKQAMTDSARILQSYEDIGNPARALPFLKKSYEVQCLMVGDLIVGNVRSGVVEKWNALYTDAVTELRRSGIALVDDHGEEITPQAKPVHLSVLPPVQKSTTEANVEQADLSVQKGPVFFEDDDFEPEKMNEEESAENLTANAEMSMAVDGAFSDMPFDAPCDFESVSDASQSDAECAGVMSSSGLDLTQAEGLTSSDLYTDDAESVSTETDVETTESGEFVEANIATLDEPESAQNELNVELKGEEDSADEPIPTDNESENFEPDTDIEPDLDIEEDLHELLAQLPPIPNTSVPVMLEEVDIVSSKFEVVTQLQMEETASQDIIEEKMEAVEESPAQALLRITNEALLKGDVAEAKIMALQLAAQMADMERERAEERVGLVRSELQVTLAFIEEGDSVSQKARERLQECAARVLGHQSGIEEKRLEIEELRTQVGALDKRMADLDEAIRALQQQRDDEAQLGAELQADMEMAMYTVGRFDEDMKQLLESEERARFALEHAQNHVSKLQSSREQQEMLIAEAEVEVLRQSKSLGDIKHTIDLVLGVVVEPIQAKVEATPMEKVCAEEEVDVTEGGDEQNDDTLDEFEVETVEATNVENHLNADGERWEEFVIRDEADEEDGDDFEDDRLREEMAMEGGEEEEEEEEEDDEEEEEWTPEDESSEMELRNQYSPEEGEQQELF